MKRSIRYYFSFVLIIIIVLSGLFDNSIHVQADSQALINAQTNKAQLQAELTVLEQQIAEKQQELAAQKGQSVSISRDISILTTQINKSKLDIKAAGLIIQKLGGEIVDKNQQIVTLTTKIETEKESLAQLLRKDREMDNKSLLYFLLSKDSLSSAYGDINTFASLKLSIQKSVDEINGTKIATEAEKQSLEQKKNQTIDTQVQLENAKNKVVVSEQQKQQLLSISQNKEKAYQLILADQAKRRAEILSMLFNLRDTSAIPFGQALDFANQASKITGVDPAFILAIITQESNLGTDQGSCYLTNPNTGEGVGSRSGTVFSHVMKPSRDVGPFIDITTSLGRDPYKTLVSCPIAAAGVNSWGGAMGPAQFIPSTWNGIKDRVAKALGIQYSDPWNPRDAFTASAMFLADLGGSGGSYTGEIKAACRYYGTGGSTCAYGRQVMTKATNIQRNMIDPLQN